MWCDAVWCSGVRGSEEVMDGHGVIMECATGGVIGAEKEEGGKECAPADDTADTCDAV